MPHGQNYNKSKNARDKSKDKILLLYKEGWRGGRVWPSPFPSYMDSPCFASRNFN
jgi:hypothetical protein